MLHVVIMLCRMGGGFLREFDGQWSWTLVSRLSCFGVNTLCAVMLGSWDPSSTAKQ